LAVLWDVETCRLIEVCRLTEILAALIMRVIPHDEEVSSNKTNEVSPKFRNIMSNIQGNVLKSKI
jgi:hypothetical protein